MTINNKTLSTLQGLVTATTTTEGNFRTGMNDVLAQVNANQEALAISVDCPGVLTTLTGSGSYTIPSGSQAVYIVASGGGGGGAYRLLSSGDTDDAYYNGTAGGNTTVSNSSLGLSITARGGNGGSFNYAGNLTGSSVTPSSNSFIQIGRGSAGGQGRSSGATNQTSKSDANGRPATLAGVYLKSASVSGKVLSYSVGAGGSGGSTAESGQPGFIQLWIW